MNKLQDTLKVKKLGAKAVLPFRAHSNDSGLDVTPTHVYKQVRSDTWLLGTDIAVQAPGGTYIDLIARSSISKSPVIVANAFGVIDVSYTGELFIAVTPKIGEKLESFNPEQLINGKPIAQMVLRPLLIADVEEVSALSLTERGEGGFGHTNNK